MGLKREIAWMKKPWEKVDYQSTNLRELGFSIYNWNRDDRVNQIWLNTPWARLRPNQQLAATRMGYTEPTWNQIQMWRRSESAPARLTPDPSFSSAVSILSRKPSMEIGNMQPRPAVPPQLLLPTIPSFS